MPDVPAPTQVQHLEGVLAPQMARIADNLRAAAANGNGSVGDGDAMAAEMAASVGAMANVSKGFKMGVSSEVEARFFQVRFCFFLLHFADKYFWPVTTKGLTWFVFYVSVSVFVVTNGFILLF